MIDLNIVLVSGIQQSDSDIYIRFFSTIDYYKILNIVPCAIQYNLIIYFIYIVIRIC